MTNDDSGDASDLGDDPGPGDVRPVIWMREAAQRRGPRPAFTRDEIARVAVTIADDRGLEGVSIRAVASALGAGAASLYRYIDTKADLYDLMVDTVSAEYDLPARPTGDWRADLTLIADRARTVHRAHPWAFALYADASWGPSIQIYMEFFLAALEPTGLSMREQTELIAQFNSSVAGFASHERQQSEQPRDPSVHLARLRHLQQIAENPDLPHLSSAVQKMLVAEQPDTDDLFRRTVERLLDSVEVARGQRPNN